MSLFDLVSQAEKTSVVQPTEPSEATETSPAEKMPADTTAGLGTKTVTIWGPSAAGKSMLALNLAAELALLGKRALLIDADARLPALALMLGVTENPPGFTAALRLVSQERLDQQQWQRITETIEFESVSFDFLAGMNNPRRWRELEPANLILLLNWLNQRYEFVICDVSADLEPDSVAADTLKPRNQMASYLASNSAITLAVCAADVVGVNRFLWQIRALREHSFTVVANRVSSQALGSNPNRQLADTLHHFAQLAPHTFLPMDAICDQALLEAKPLVLLNKNSKLRAAIRLLAIDLELL